MNPAWTVGKVRERGELDQILALQHANLAVNVSAEEASAQSFVTAVHSLETLQRMHELAPSIVARAETQLAGYALTMRVEARAHVPILEPMFELLETLAFHGHPLRDTRYYVMGQVCVARAFRGQGVFDALYRGHREHYQERFELLVTEVSTRNGRSLRAHARVGFEPLYRYRDSVDEWVILGWDWANAAEKRA
ncbi:MAG: GNAT family N-acetyltransferase [Deltaproteobacteria bacterium]